VQNLPAAYPRAFHCEHTPSKSRIHALVHHTGGPATLTAVLTLTDPELAEQAARILNQALEASPGPVLRGEIEQLTLQLPTAPRASLIQALASLESGTWPTPTTPPWPTLDEEDERSETPRRLHDEFTRTPRLARLAQHPGLVVRIGRLLEVHVHDRARTLNAATASGWTPDEEDDLHEDDHILSAVMWLADQDCTIPGADILTDASNGQCLSPGDDEIADWSQEPVTFDFGTGYLLRQPRPDAGDDPDQPRPDYTALFPIPDCGHLANNGDVNDIEVCERCEAFTLTPRTAAALSWALGTLAEQCLMDVDEHGDKPVDPNETWSVFDELPRLTWRQDAAWRTRFSQAVRHLENDLDHGRLPLPTCTAEEVALHLALDETEVVLDMAADSDHYAHTVFGDLPEHPRDYDWDLCHTALFQDSDVLFLYDNAADGIEDPETDINKHFRIGDLRPAHWFDTFLNMKPRKPTSAPEQN
jgi:hypothetical protein